jgi:hypothetical protein
VRTSMPNPCHEAPHPEANYPSQQDKIENMLTN